MELNIDSTLRGYKNFIKDAFIKSCGFNNLEIVSIQDNKIKCVCDDKEYVIHCYTFMDFSEMNRCVIKAELYDKHNQLVEDKFLDLKRK